MKEVTLRRWQVGGAFAIIVAIFVVGLFKVQNTSNRADRVAEQNTALIRRERRDRLDQLIERRRLNVETLLLICRKQNETNTILADLITRISKLPASRPATVAQARARARLFRVFAFELRRLQPRTCKSLPITKVAP